MAERIRTMDACRWVLTAVLVLASLLRAAPAAGNEIDDARQRLEQQLSYLQQMEPFVERPDLARLFFLKSASQSVLSSIATNGLSHRSTFQEYQKLIVAYRYSIAFFKAIESDNTREPIIQVLKIYEEISRILGFDDSPYTQITLSVYTQMERLVRQFQDLPVSEVLKLKVSNLRTVLAVTIAAARAKGGDRRTVYPIAERSYLAVKALYPDFNKIASADAAFNISLEMMGLNEFYGEFAEFSQ